MELLIPEEMSPISFRSSCLDSFFPATTQDMCVNYPNITGHCWRCNQQNHEDLILLHFSGNIKFIYILCLLPASVCPPPEGTSAGF